MANMRIPKNRTFPACLCNLQPNLNNSYCIGARNHSAASLPLAFPCKKKKMRKSQHGGTAAIVNEVTKIMAACKFQINPNHNFTLVDDILSFHTWNQPFSDMKLLFIFCFY